MFTYQLLEFSCHISIEENKRSSTASIHFHRTPSKRFQFLQLLWKKANCLSNNSGLKIIFGSFRPAKSPFWPDISEFTQQDGRKKRTTKRSCVTRLLLTCFVVIFSPASQKHLPRISTHSRGPKTLLSAQVRVAN